MKENIEERACHLAVYMIENRATVRAAAQKFGISKSTVHTDDTIGNAGGQNGSRRESECRMPESSGMRHN